MKKPDKETQEMWRRRREAKDAFFREQADRLGASVIRKKILRLWDLSFRNDARVHGGVPVRDLAALLGELWELRKELHGYANAGVFEPSSFITSLDSDSSQLAFDLANAGKITAAPPRNPRGLQELRINVQAPEAGRAKRAKRARKPGGTPEVKPPVKEEVAKESRRPARVGGAKILTADEIVAAALRKYGL